MLIVMSNLDNMSKGVFQVKEMLWAKSQSGKNGVFRYIACLDT